MLNRVNRLTKEKDFKRVFRAKKKYYLPGFRVLLIKAPNNLKESRFGFIVSKKVSKKAVVRNKIKRQLREAISAKLNQINKGFDIIIVVTPGFESDNFQPLQTNLNHLFQKAGII